VRNFAYLQILADYCDFYGETVVKSVVNDG